MKNSSDLRILHLASSGSGGAGIAASRMHNAMLKHNFESTIISRGGLSSKSMNSSLKPGIVKLFNSKAITLFQSKVLQKDNLMTPFSLNCVPKELIDFINPNIIHIHSFYNLIDLDGLKKILERKNCQVFITLHDQRFLTGGCHYSGECVGYLSECINCPSTYKLFQRYIHKQKVKSTDIFNDSENVTFMAPSNWLVRMFLEINNSKSNPILQVHNPIPAVILKSEVKNDGGSLIINGDKISIAFIAEKLANPLKGINIFINSLEFIDIEKRRNLLICFIGNGLPKLLEDQLKKMQVSFEVLYFSRYDDLANKLRRIDHVVVPSTQDNSPNVVAEALMNGCNVIGSDVPGIKEILNRFNMKVFTKENSIELGNLLNNVTKNKNRSKIELFAESIFGEDAFVEFVSKVYLDKLNSS